MTKNVGKKSVKCVFQRAEIVTESGVHWWIVKELNIKKNKYSIDLEE